MKNLLGSGDRVRVIAPAALTGGTAFLLGVRLLVPLSDAASGEEVECLTRGEITHAKTSALAISAGDTLYWDDTNKVFFKTVGTNKEGGTALEDAANPSATVRMLFDPTYRVSTAA